MIKFRCRRARETHPFGPWRHPPTLHELKKRAGRSRALLPSCWPAAHGAAPEGGWLAGSDLRRGRRG